MKKKSFAIFRKTLFLSLIAAILISATTDKKAPKNALDKLIDRYYSFHKQFPQQKIYIQTDKPYYISGDEMYGKIYLVNETRWDIDSALSKKIYVELVNSENSVVEKTIVNGIYSSHGFTFHLPDSIHGGNYILRAYTSWMAGFNNTQNIFRTGIHIFNRKNHDVRLPVNTSLDSNMDIQFLPEGGYLVNGIENNVAFKAIDQSGHGTDVSGFVKDSKGDIVCKFSSTHLGMGKFEFIPETGISYTAYVKKEDGKEFQYPLSPANNHAYQLSVIARSKDSLSFRVALGDSLYKKNKASYFIATSHSGVYFTSRGTGMYTETISLKSFPEGIAQLTLFDNDMQPVSERLIFVDHPDANLIVTTNKTNYRQREKVTLKLKTEDTTGKLLKGMYSISVTDDNVVKHDENDGNIKSHLLLSPYMKGDIEEPGYYFKNDDSATLENLDLVMLTHGWSRFTWNDIKNGITINPKDKDNNLSISGKITTSKNKPAVGYSVTLLSPSNNAFIGSDVTNGQGEFHFTGIDYSDSTTFLIQTENRRGVNEDVNVSIDPEPFPLNATGSSLVPGYLASGETNGFNSGYLTSGETNGFNFYKRFMYDSIELNRKEKVLKEIILSKSKKLNYDESRRVSPTSYVITPDKIETYANGAASLEDLMYMVPGFTKTNGGFTFFGINADPSKSALIVVDGVEANYGLKDIDPHTVAFVEVLRGGEAALYGMRGGAGVVVVHTKTGSEINMDNYKQKGMHVFKAGGYQVAKEFYSPNYETDESQNIKSKDVRTTLYWNGNVNTDSKTTTNLSFYTADMPANYTVTIEGIAANGGLIHETIPIKRTRQ